MKNFKILTIVGVVAVLAAALLTTSVFAMGMMGGGYGTATDIAIHHTRPVQR